MRWFPPFWFLGIYECVMWGARAPAVFHGLAHLGVTVTAGLLLAAAALYPLGYQRRVRQWIEGSGPRSSATRRDALQSAVTRALLRSPQARAVGCFVAQTLLRSERLHLYLAMYAGVGIALVLSGLLAFQVEGSMVRPVFAAEGLRLAVPVAAFSTVAGLKTASRSPLGRAGSWVFRVIGGAAGPDELRGARVLVAALAVSVTLLAVAILNAAAPAGTRTGIGVTVQALTGAGLALILTELFFTGVRTIPFTATPRPSLHQLPLTLVRYFVIFPAFALTMAGAEEWMELSATRVLAGAVMLAASYLAARELRRWFEARPVPTEELLITGLGLRDE